MLFLLGSTFGIIKKVIGKGIEHAIAKDGRGAVLRQPVLLPENGVDHEIAQGPDPYPPASFQVQSCGPAGESPSWKPERR